MSVLPVATTIRDARLAVLPWRQKGETVAFVPTMGALHDGHRALIERARKITNRVIVSIFVNPMQFGPSEDLNTYPRPLDADRKMLTDIGCDLLYMPTVDEIYPDGFVSRVDPGPIANILEGAARPGHFVGVATVVVKLLLQLMPDAAFFGEKDYQQLLVLRRVVHDLDLPVHVIGLSTVRDHDGLAFSSRNAYLSAADRPRAAALPRLLRHAVADLQQGKEIDGVLRDTARHLTEAGFTVDYVELADAETLAPVRDLVAPARLLAAARIGGTRLIDNMAVER